MNLTNWNWGYYCCFIEKDFSSISSGPGAANSYSDTINPSFEHTISNVTYNSDYSTIEIGIETLSFGLMNISEIYPCKNYYACYYESVLNPD